MKGPAPDQLDPGETDGETVSGVLLPDRPLNLHQAVQEVVSDVLGENCNVSVNRKGTVTIPWPSRGNAALSEFTTQFFFTLAFPCLFPYGSGDFHINRPRTCSSLADWAEHLLWYLDGRFASHQYFKFVVHNMIMHKSAIEKGNFIVRQQLGDQHITVSNLKDSIKNGDDTLSKKIVYLSATLRGTSQYWAQRAKELQALTHYNISKGLGLPSIFATGSCAEFHFKPLKRLLSMYVKKTTGEDINLDDRSVLFKTLQQNTHIVAQYFDFRTTSYFSQVMGPVFGVDSFWYRQEFTKSRGMVHWHGLCWRSDREPHVLLHQAISDGLSESTCAERLSEWAAIQFGLTANHPAGKDHLGNPRTDLWPPPEGSAPEPPEEKNPLVKLLMDVSSTQDSLLEDHLLLTNRFNIHRCSDYCLKSMANGKKTCRMEFGTPDSPGKVIRNSPALVKDKNGSLRLEMARDHPLLVQHSQYHTQGWRANGDISLILSKGSPDNPSVDDITATLRYITGYACKGNQPTGAISDLFNDLVNCADESSGATAKSMCNKVLISTVKRDISAVEASFELSRLPLYRSSHQFKTVSLSGVRLLERDGSAVTRNNAIDQYLKRKSDDCSSLYNFVCKGGRVPVFTACCTQPDWPLQEDYCRSMLILHWPNWRHLSDIKNENTTWCEKMTHFLASNECPNFVKADIERVKQKNSLGEIDEDQDDYIFSSQQPDWMDIVKPNADFECPDSDFEFDDGGDSYNWSAESLQYPSDKGKAWLKTIETSLHSNEDSLKIPDVDLIKMNTDQKFAFNIILTKLLEFSNGTTNFQPLRMIVTGTAGSGKSFLIKCIVKATRLIFNDNSCVQVVCPTGNSAHIIDGVTLHSFFKVPTFNKSKELSPPQGSAGEELQSNCNSLRALLVDERSLIGASTLGWMEYNCRYGANNGSNCQQSWGGLPVVVFFGDDVQLPPVLDSPVYDCNSKLTSALHGVLVWQEFTSAVCLKTIVRQNEDEQALRDVLSSIREYKISTHQAKWLQNFQWRNLSHKYGNEIMHRFSENSLHVFPTHAEVWSHNKQKILEINVEYPIAKVTAINKGQHAKTSAGDKAGGLSPVIYLCKCAAVMLTVNLCVKYGLFNGAIGIVVDILYPEDKKPSSDTLPTAVMVQFNNYSGPAFITGHPKVIPIMPVERRIDCVCRTCKRKQIPLRLGWATTIHKCQGMTVGDGENHRHIIINPGPRQFESRNPGALFVALSRAKSAGNETTVPDFAWHPSVL
ncbi:uncharacterized protein LOC128554571, partial [Mercenaria mercenaria]|uniref:uncharacterized protein LOC128554571 n=1 Tax=Mercenaria mercenaria TaxID=6596 RepID=UPI00234E6CE3